MSVPGRLYTDPPTPFGWAKTVQQLTVPEIAGGDIFTVEWVRARPKHHTKWVAQLESWVTFWGLGRWEIDKVTCYDFRACSGATPALPYHPPGRLVPLYPGLGHRATGLPNPLASGPGRESARPRAMPRRQPTGQLWTAAAIDLGHGSPTKACPPPTASWPGAPAVGPSIGSPGPLDLPSQSPGNHPPPRSLPWLPRQLVSLPPRSDAGPSKPTKPTNPRCAPGRVPAETALPNPPRRPIGFPQRVPLLRLPMTSKPTGYLPPRSDAGTWPALWLPLQAPGSTGSIDGEV
ncbi:hypothetical protein N7475_001065 [Penicillium sp. IBT 31633x]|nr:hypothetical protein N7475_001065 [Penicillium sp. IBT 31633x]